MKLPPFSLERRLEGAELVDMKTFDLKYVSSTIARLEKEFGIEFNRNEIIPSDNTLPKRVFEAGLTLLLETGIYVLDEKRVVKVDEEEVKEAIGNARDTLIVGRGKDSRILRLRRNGLDGKPFIFGGLAGTPTPEGYFLESVLSYVQEPLVDAVDHGSINIVKGVKVRNLAPSEALATVVEVSKVKEALRVGGRPGMHVLGAESSITSIGSLSAMALNLLEEGDAQLVPVLNELKVDFHQLTKAAIGLMKGIHNASLVDPIVGGFARGATGTAICSIAEILIAQLAYGASYHLIHPVHIRLEATSVRECMWVESVVGLSGCFLNSPLVGDIWPAAGAGSEMVFYEIAANTIVATVSGLNLLGPTPTAGKKPYGSGLEARFMGEVAQAVIKEKLSPGDANDIVLELLKKYETKLGNPEPGKSFPELYDLAEIKPREDYLKLYRKIKAELGNLGLSIE